MIGYHSRYRHVADYTLEQGRVSTGRQGRRAVLALEEEFLGLSRARDVWGRDD